MIRSRTFYLFVLTYDWSFAADTDRMGTNPALRRSSPRSYQPQVRRFSLLTSAPDRRLKERVWTDLVKSAYSHRMTTLTAAEFKVTFVNSPTNFVRGVTRYALLLRVPRRYLRTILISSRWAVRSLCGVRTQSPGSRCQFGFILRSSRYSRENDST